MINRTPPAASSHIVSELVLRLSPTHREIFEERAAIMEFDGGLPREQAEELGLLDVLLHHPEALLPVRAFQIVRDGEQRFLVTTPERMSAERLISLGYAVTEVTDIPALLSRHFHGIAVLSPARKDTR
mgnify:CR=1 FL=1